MVVKFQGPDNKKKSRIIWDMRESGVNQRCDPSERILLPRLMDAVHDALDLMRAGKTPILAAVDIADAFHNVPAGRDKKYTMAFTEMESGKRHFVLYDVLVFGSRSSPTIWGRFAAFLGGPSQLLCQRPELRFTWTIPCSLFRMRPKRASTSSPESLSSPTSWATL